MTKKKIDTDVKNNFPFVRFDQEETARNFHDIQEPLRSISNLLQLLATRQTIQNDPEAKKYVYYALKNVEKLRDWALEALSSFLSQEKLKEAVSLYDLIEEIQLLLKFQMAKRKCQIKTPQDLKIACHRTLLFRIFKNLIENSLKHAQAKQLEIKIKEDLEKSDKRQLVIMYEDNGLPSKQITKQEKGHGEGLRIVYALLHSLGGRLEQVGGDLCFNKFRLIFPK